MLRPNNEKKCFNEQIQPRHPDRPRHRVPPRVCARVHAERVPQFKIVFDNITTRALVKPYGRGVANGSSRREIRDVSEDGFVATSSIFDGKSLADLVDALFERIACPPCGEERLAER
jgi:hypothetical protein